MEKSKDLFLVKEIPGFSTHFGHLISMMNYARFTTLETVQNLTTEQLDYRIDGQGNSIGALLEHIISMEIWHQICTFENKEPTDEDLGRWKAGLELGEYVEQIKGHDLNYYLRNLEESRDKTLTEFTKKDDDWLYNEYIYDNICMVNNYWVWFHVFEDEINHRGQIRLIRKKIKELGI